MKRLLFVLIAISIGSSCLARKKKERPMFPDGVTPVVSCHRHPFHLSQFSFTDIQATDKQGTFDIKEIENITVKNVLLNGKPVEVHP